ncbi:MAG: potassium transporter Kup [Caulobacteraceae bacterium]|nr:potassium transporter Kup [Caulobacteraceae bacterium]
MTAASPATSGPEPLKLKRGLGLALGATGVVYGDIGTSPLYAFKESIHHLSEGGAVARADVLGVVSLMFWALMAIVTLKYVALLMRFDNRGEGGVLALMALVQKVTGGAGGWILGVGMLGAGLFFGDAILTPAISVLSAVEGLKTVEALGDRLDAYIVPISLAILVALFLVQRGGTGKVGRWFGPVCAVWFIVIAGLGLVQVTAQPEVLAALNPASAFATLAGHPGLALAVLGSVFLTVTGAEALYADMGHFGRGPIQGAWLLLVFPALTLNYLGQGALVLRDPTFASNPFFGLAPTWFQLPLVALATLATVIASQAVISGAFSITQQAIQLGLLPRLTLRSTSEDHEGQVFAPLVNGILLIGVALLVIGFGSSSALASAYGVSVIGAMITSSLLAVVAVHRVKGRPLWLAALLFSPFLLVEGVFALANLMKVAHGGYVPLLIAAAVVLVMATWRRGAARVRAAEKSNVSVRELVELLANRPPMTAKGTAVFLTADPDEAPASLLHNLKHNQVVHEQVVLLTVRFVSRPRVPDAERVEMEHMAPRIVRLFLTYGFMESPNVSHGLALARGQGLKFDIMRTSFFLSRRTLVPGRRGGLGALQDLLFQFLMRNAARAADFFSLPPTRVVELGAQVSL